MREKIEHSPITPVVMLIGLVVVGLLIYMLANSAWLLVVLVPAALAGFYSYDRLSHLWQRAYAGFLIAVSVAYVVILVQLVRTNINTLPEWDFTSFWLHGTTAARGQNFYDPQYAQDLAKDLTLSDEFRTEIVDVGFWYPPPSIFLFVPLGWFDLKTATVVWYAAQLAVLLITMALLWRIFFRDKGLMGLLLVGTLLLMLHSTYTTFQYGQTNFLVLLVLLLLYWDLKHLRSGLWIAIGIFVKPFLLVLPLYTLLRKRWSALVTMIVSLGVIAGATVLVFGMNTFTSYLTENPTNKLPNYVYVESDNQSLLSTLLRVTGYDSGSKSPVTYPLFLIMACVLGVATIFIVYRLSSDHDDLAVALLIGLALLIYPASLAHYSVVLIIPVLLLLKQQGMFPMWKWSVIALVTVIYVTLSMSNGDKTFIAYVLSWLTLAGLSVWTFWRTDAKVGEPVKPGLSDARS